MFSFSNHFQKLATNPVVIRRWSWVGGVDGSEARSSKARAMGCRRKLDLPGTQRAGVQKGKRWLENLWMQSNRLSWGRRAARAAGHSSSRDHYPASENRTKEAGSCSWGWVTIPLRAVCNTEPPSHQPPQRAPGETELEELARARVCCTHGASGEGMIQPRSCKASSPTWLLGARRYRIRTRRRTWPFSLFPAHGSTSISLVAIRILKCLWIYSGW